MPARSLVIKVTAGKDEPERSGQALPSLHSSLYHPQPEPTITTGVRAMTAAVIHLAAKK